MCKSHVNTKPFYISDLNNHRAWYSVVLESIPHRHCTTLSMEIYAILVKLYHSNLINMKKSEVNNTIYLFRNFFRKCSGLSKNRIDSDLIIILLNQEYEKELRPSYSK